MARAIAGYLKVNEVDINAECAGGFTVLHFACWSDPYCDAGVVEGLLDLGADGWKVSDRGLTPMHVAARFAKDVSPLRALASRVGKGLVNKPSYGGSTPFHWATCRWGFSEGGEEVFEFLVRNGAYLNFPNASGLTPLQNARRVGTAWELSNLVHRIDPRALEWKPNEAIWRYWASTFQEGRNPQASPGESSTSTTGESSPLRLRKNSESSVGTFFTAPCEPGMLDTVKDDSEEGEDNEDDEDVEHDWALEDYWEVENEEDEEDEKND
jgi:hypothetical protein